MKLKGLFIVAVAAMTCLAPAVADEARSEARIERVVHSLQPRTSLRHAPAAPASLTDRMEFYKTPAVSIAVVDEGKLAWARAFGVRRYGSREPVTTNTLFQAASISKPIFALAVMRAVQEGALDLDSDINEYLTSWKVPPNGAWQPRITLRQILTHSAGLTVHGFPGYRFSEEIPSLVQMLNGTGPSKTSPVHVNIVPSLQTRYSGGGTMVGQQVVIDRFGKPFPEWMRETVLKPLKLSRSTFEQPLPKRLRRHAAVAHPFGFREVEGGSHIYPEMAPAGLWTTPSDLAHIGMELQAVLAGGGSGLFSSNIVAEMLTPQIESMGIGFALEGKGETMRFGHGGWNEGFLSEFRMYKHHGKGAVIMINSNEGGELITEILRAIAREYQWPNYNPKDDPKQINREVIAPEELAPHLGTFEVRPGVRFTLRIEEKRLFLEWMNQPPLEFFAASKTNYFSHSINTELHLEAPDKVTLSQDNQRFTGERVK